MLGEMGTAAARKKDAICRGCCCCVGPRTSRSINDRQETVAADEEGRARR